MNLLGFFFGILVFGQSSTQTGGIPGVPNPWFSFGPAIAWGAIWAQIVLHFFNKGESLHKDYWASGRINSIIAAIQADKFIPAISQMFLKITEAQTDKRKRPEKEIEELLQSAHFLPELRDAQEAMSEMENLRSTFERIKRSAARIWKWGVGHLFLTVLLPTCYVFLFPLAIFWHWMLIAVGVGWIMTLGIIVFGLFRIHALISDFNLVLEANEENRDQ